MSPQTKRRSKHINAYALLAFPDRDGRQLYTQTKTKSRGYKLAADILLEFATKHRATDSYFHYLREPGGLLNVQCVPCRRCAFSSRQSSRLASRHTTHDLTILLARELQQYKGALFTRG